MAKKIKADEYGLSFTVDNPNEGELTVFYDQKECGLLPPGSCHLLEPMSKMILDLSNGSAQVDLNLFDMGIIRVNFNQHTFKTVSLIKHEEIERLVMMSVASLCVGTSYFEVRIDELVKEVFKPCEV